MKLRYYPETDSLYISFNDQPSAEAVEIADGVVADLDATGRVTGLDIDQVSEQLDLGTLDTIGLPVPSRR